MLAIEAKNGGKGEYNQEEGYFDIIEFADNDREEVGKFDLKVKLNDYEYNELL